MIVSIKPASFLSHTMMAQARGEVHPGAGESVRSVSKHVLSHVEGHE